jgi:FdhD protein
MTGLPPRGCAGHQAAAVPGTGAHLGSHAPVDLTLAEELPIALSCGGIAHVVMMGSPQDLEDFAVGFAITDGLVQGCADIRGIDACVSADAARVDLVLAPEAFRRFLAGRRRRSLRGHASCGVCGVEDLADLPQAGHAARTNAARGVAPAVVRRMVDGLRVVQPLGRATRATHAALFAGPAGEILLVREDIGRHNALDKLIGGASRAGVDLAAGACLITSRCSFEMVQKAVAAGIGTLIALSAPTALAVRFAEANGLTLIGHAASADPVRFGGCAAPRCDGMACGSERRIEGSVGRLPDRIERACGPLQHTGAECGAMPAGEHLPASRAGMAIVEAAVCASDPSGRARSGSPPWQR